MTQAQLPFLMQHLRRVVGPNGTGVTDAQLLERFVNLRDAAAFELLLWRHERMVLGVCRAILRRQQDAEDAFQATFLALACKAGCIGKREAVASWLYKVAHRVAQRQRANTANRQSHEKQLDRFGERCSEDPFTKAVESELRNVLHEEVNRLPEKYRAPVVLCYLEGQTNEEAALQLCCPTGTVVTRLARARQRLRGRLERRGLALSVGAVAAALVESENLEAAPTAVRDRTARAAVQFAADQTAAGLVSANVVTLTRGVLKTMLMNKVKVVAMILLSIGLIGTGSAVFAFRTAIPDKLPEQRGSFGQLAPSNIAHDDSKAQPDTPKAESDAEPDKKPDNPKGSDSTQTVKEDMNQTFKTGKSPRVIVDLYNGGIEIKATTEASVNVLVHKQGKGKTKEAATGALKKVDVKMTQDGDEVVVRARRTGNEHADDTWSNVAAELTVPPGAVLELHTSNGPVTLTAGTGKVNIETSNGPIEVKESKGSLDLRTQNGAITASGVTGRVVLKTHNGKVIIHGEKAVVTAETSNGFVEFQGSLATGEHSFSTSNGAITLTLPPDAAFKLDAETSRGSIENEFSTAKVATKGKLHAENNAGTSAVAVIKLHTSNGGIAIRKEKKKE